MIGRRMSRLSAKQAAWAWHELAIQLEGMEMLDVPKFRHITGALRIVTISARRGSGVPLDKS